MGKAVTHRTRERRPSGGCGGGAERLGERPGLRPPRRRREFDHAAEQPLFRPPPQQHRAIRPRQPKGDAVPPRPLRLFGARRQILGDAACRGGAGRAPRAQHAARTARRADRGAQIHHRLREIAGAPIRHQPCRELPQPRFRRRHRLGDGVKPGDDALDIAVDCRGRAGRTRSPRSPPRCSRRSRAMRAMPRARTETRRHAARRRRGRRRADCGRARNSRAPATPAGPRRARLRRAPRRRASAPRIGRNTGGRSPLSSAAA